jgi:hypothetical protein
MQQDGKSTEDIAKELKLNPALVKKVLGENTVISEGLSDAQISQLKKEYEPLKGKTITTSQYQQLKNILFKLQDGDLEKLQKQNIPFASTGAGSILRVRKSFSHLGTKITNVKVPGLEGMAEETFKDNIVKKLVKPIQDFNKKKEEPKKEEVQLEEKSIDTKNLIKTIKDLRIDDLKVNDDKNFIHIVKEFDPTIDKLNDVKSEYMDIVKTLNKKGINYKPNANQDIEKNQEFIQINFSVKKEEVKESTSRNINEGARALVEAIAALQKKADKTGMPYSILKQVYDRGMAAWKGGHRPGASQHQWAFARVNSFVTKSSGTWGGADSDLAKKVKGKE